MKNSIKEETLNKIVEAAIYEFGEKGYDQASTAKIMEKAALSKGLLFHYFKSKENLYIFCAKKVVEEFVDAFYDADFLKERDCFKRINQSVTHKVDYILKHESRGKMLIKLNAFGIPLYSIELKEIADYIESKTADVKRDFFSGIDFSSFRKDFEPEFIMEYIYSIIEVYSRRMSQINNLNLSNIEEAKEQFIAQSKTLEKLICYGVFEQNTQ